MLEREIQTSLKCPKFRRLAIRGEAGGAVAGVGEKR